MVLRSDGGEAQTDRPLLLLTSDGVELATRAWLIEGGAEAVVVLVHGLSASKDDANVVALAERLRDRGFDVVSYDARGHGESGGYSTLGDLEHHDVAAAVAWARHRSGRVVLVGASMGGIAVLRHAATNPDVAGVVSVSSPAEWRMPLRPRALFTAGLTRTKPGRWVARHQQVRIHPVWTAPEPPRSLAARVTSPLAIVHGHRDRLVPTSAALELYKRGEGRRRLVLVPEMGHAFHPAGHGAICDAVDWVLEQGDDPGPATLPA
ncbi:MAG TPA: alpha/beta fold hydrolase [Acidimicrobiales bacterium]|nr:alpha/beta fold hydrolase [Acidimicrobiales bacterium]